jgi:hypothetical protein
MRKTPLILPPLLLLLGLVPAILGAQSHLSVPVEDPVYRLLETARIRGLCPPLPEAKPYSRAVILRALDDIIARGREEKPGGLKETELEILRAERNRWTAGEGKAIDWERGMVYRELSSEKHQTRVSMEGGLTLDSFLGAGLSVPGGLEWGTNTWGTGYFNGDLGRSFSYGLNLSVGLVRAKTPVLGTYHTYYPEPGADPSLVNGEINGRPDDKARQDRIITVYGQPWAFFPYTFRKRWDGFLMDPANLTGSGSLSRADSLSGGIAFLPEMSGVFFNGLIQYRIGRIRREWGAMGTGSSIMFNQNAPPFVAAELTASPFSWLHFSALTGELEYFKDEGGGFKESARDSQNMFSIAMAELNYKNYLHLDFGSTSIWAKRLELGYPFPLIDNFFYQNNIGDFDNPALFLNLKGMLPGFFSLWVSLFLDEINPEAGVFQRDRAMFAYQAGGAVHLPFLSFSTLRLSYTKLEPYVYTHTREFLPWYGGNSSEPAAMRQGYTTENTGLGYYLPPNSDELKLRFETMPALMTSLHLQYQMIRHGADWGSKAVDGSNYQSELDPSGRSEKPVLKKFFLQDGAYQWFHIVKAGFSKTFAPPRAPRFELYSEAGLVFAYVTDIEGPANSGVPAPYRIIDTGEYPSSNSFLLSFGFRLFPR